MADEIGPHQSAKERPTYVLRLRPERDVPNPTRALRRALKVLLRRFGLRAVSCEQEGGTP